MTQETAIRLIVASKKSRPIFVFPTIRYGLALFAISCNSSSIKTTWSESQRTGRETCSMIPLLNKANEDNLLEITSVG